MLAGGGVALLVALGIGIFVAGRVTRPVVDMQSIARQMSEGNFLVRAPSRSTDEIGTLGRSLNVLAARLREKVQDLEQERAKVTAILDGMVEGVVAVDGHEHVLVGEGDRGPSVQLGDEPVEARPGLSATTSLPLRSAAIAIAARRSGTAAVTITSTVGSPSRVSGSSAHSTSGQRSTTFRATAADLSSEKTPTSSQPWPNSPSI